MPAPRTIRIALASVALAAPAAFLAACAPPRAVMRAPVFARCAAAGVGACEEMTNSIVLLADGDVDVARQQLWETGAKSSPEKLRAFAAALLELGANPGAEAYADSMIQASSLLEIQAERAAKSAPPAASLTANPEGASTAAPAQGSPGDPAEKAARARPRGAEGQSDAERPKPLIVTVVTAETDPARLEGGTATPGASPAKVVCAPLGGAGNTSLSAVCIKAIEGPFVVTDLRAGPGCGDDLFVASGASTSPRWSILFRASERPGIPIHGARLAVKEGEFLFVGAQAAPPAKVSADVRCSILWSGFRPYLARPDQPEHGQVPRDLGF